jgi:hypothetical protein
MDSLTTFVIRHLRHRARVDETDICRLTRLSLDNAHLTQKLGESRGLGKVKLTPQCIKSRFLSLES